MAKNNIKTKILKVVTVKIFIVFFEKSVFIFLERYIYSAVRRLQAVFYFFFHFKIYSGLARIFFRHQRNGVRLFAGFDAFAVHTPSVSCLAVFLVEKIRFRPYIYVFDFQRYFTSQSFCVKRSLQWVIGVKNKFWRNTFRRQVEIFLKTRSLVFGGNFHSYYIIAHIVHSYKQSIFAGAGIIRQIFIIKSPIIDKI